MKKVKTTQKVNPCRCDAYPFPHRLFGGKCEGDNDLQYHYTETEYDLLGVSFQAFTNPSI